MFGKKIRLFKLLGFEVSIDLSWIIIAVLIVWSLSSGFFPYMYEDLPKGAYLWMGIIGALGFFLSIIVHEFSHSIVARRNGMPMKGITLFIFGGVAEMSGEPPDAKTEFKMAVVGPLSSLGIAAVCYGIYRVTAYVLPIQVTGVIWYLAIINAILAGFNLLPAFPLDGGRILRSVIWSIKKDIRSATRISSKIGGGFAYGFMFLGVINILRGNFIGGIWWALIGMFLLNATKMSYRQIVTREALTGEHVSRFMIHDPVTVPPDISLAKLVNDYIYRYHFKMFPVVRGKDLIGCISTRQVKEVPGEDWERVSVSEIAENCSSDNTVEEDTDAIEALSMMNRTASSRLMVVRGKELVGVITLKDMLKFLSLKVDLEGGSQ